MLIACVNFSVISVLFGVGVTVGGADALSALVNTVVKLCKSVLWKIDEKSIEGAAVVVVADADES